MVRGAQAGAGVDGGAAGNPDNGVCRRETVREADSQLSRAQMPALLSGPAQKRGDGLDRAILRGAGVHGVLVQKDLHGVKRYMQ